jgi:hypothetical protein
MKYAVAVALILTHATPILAQNGKYNVTPPPPYTRADFIRDCVAQAPAFPEYLRRAWVASCQKEAP